MRDLRVEVDDLTAEQKRADADVEQVKARRVRDQGMIDAGSITDPKALQRMLGELESLQRRISDLEDVEIEVMERLETAQARARGARRASWSRLDRDMAALEATRAHKAGELEQPSSRQVVGRAQDHRVRRAGGPDGRCTRSCASRRAASARPRCGASECEGCRLTLNPSDLAAIAAAPTDEVVRCEECSRILVRTGESGL